MSERIDIKDINKRGLLRDSDTFCMLPWIHVHQSPDGSVGGCCIAGNGPVINSDHLDDLINSEYMAELRNDMLAGVKNKSCEICYNHERDFGSSNRTGSNLTYEHHFYDAVKQTNTDGTLDDFKMRYFDIRFNNICNMKCRSCGAGYSSLWHAENEKHGTPDDISWPGIAIVETDLIDDVLKHINNLESAYFAGGEPLVTEQHYRLLKAFIDNGRTDLHLTYNSNASILNFKNHDLVDMWDKFTHPVDFVASIDHSGPKAEYIRNGTNWETLEANLMRLSQLSADKISLSISAVGSVYNYLTFDKHFKRMFNLGIIHPEYVGHAGIYPLYEPSKICAQMLPKHLKVIGRKRNEALIQWLTEQGYPEDDHLIRAITEFMDFVEQQDTWEEQKESFQEYTRYLDGIRNESFVKTFPELAEMMDD